MGHPLDNPVWYALIGSHAQYAVGSGLARHYPRDVAPFSAIEIATPAAYADMAIDLPPDTEARLFRLSDEPPPDGWVKVDAFPMLQMIAKEGLVTGAAAPPHDVLTIEDIEEMMDLVAIAKPGPFGTRTPELGTYLGIRESGRLVAMAGERMRIPGYVELSTICTHPAAQGRGLAAQLTVQLMKAAAQHGEVPFLHVRPENSAAVSLYKGLGFEVRREIWVLWRKPVADIP